MDRKVGRTIKSGLFSRFAVLALTFSALVGCSVLKEDGAAIAVHPAMGLAQGFIGPIPAFEVSLYTYLRTNCKTCHGQSQNPLHSQTDVKAAFEISQAYVDFENPSRSRLVRKGSDGHCGAICSPADKGKALTAAVQYWWDHGMAPRDGSDPFGDDGAVTLSEKPVPANLPVRNPNNDNTDCTNTNSTDYGKITWNLSEVSSLFGTAQFVIRIRQYSTTSYEICAPQFIIPRPAAGQPAMSIYIRKIYASINGVVDPAYSSYKSINDVYRYDSTNNAASVTKIIRPVGMVMSKDKGNDLDRFGFVFDRLQLNDDCKRLAEFVQVFKPDIQSNRFGCISCHTNVNSVNPTAGQRFNMNQSDAALCSEAWARVDRHTPENSLLFRKPFNPIPNHPTVNGFTGSPDEPWRAWLNGWVELELGARGL